MASGYGLQSVPVDSMGTSIYFGLVGANSTDGQAAIPFFQQEKEQFLEYDISQINLFP